MPSAYHNQCSVAQRSHTTEVVFVCLNADEERFHARILHSEKFLHFVSVSEEQPHIKTKT